MADPDQLALLKKCSEAKDCTEWNNWLKGRREADPDFRPDLSAANLSRANLRWANLSAAHLSAADLSAADLSQANLREANLSGANLSAADLSAAHLRAAHLRAAHLRGADLSHANLLAVTIDESTQIDSKWRLVWQIVNGQADKSKLSNQDLSMADLGGADLSGANLSGANLSGANLSGANFGGANLSGADLSGANLSGADLSQANLSEANLFAAHLYWADLYEANLRGANLRGANLLGADLYETVLGGANLDEAELRHTRFTNVDLSQVKGLDTVKHEGPSTIGIDTLYKSGGNIPEVFLRGCGVPETMITFARSLVGKAIEFYSAFISYSSKDQEFAERLHADLQAKGVRVWFAPEDLKIGSPFLKEIDDAVRLYDKFMIVLSEHALASNWVEHEVATALHRELLEKRQVLFPIRLDDAVLHSPGGWAATISQHHIGDFTHWKNHDQYQKAFARLLRDLQSEAKPAL
ncbi:MAG: toll/interleukin-1 receptor domain-containing protein [Anaerolineae bacterium]